VRNLKHSNNVQIVVISLIHRFEMIADLRPLLLLLFLYIRERLREERIEAARGRGAVYGSSSLMSASPPKATRQWRLREVGLVPTH
jgi:hypothetical protein